MSVSGVFVTVDCLQDMFRVAKMTKVKKEDDLMDINIGIGIGNEWWQKAKVSRSLPTKFSLIRNIYQELKL